MKVPFTQFHVFYDSGPFIVCVDDLPDRSNKRASEATKFIREAINEKIARELYAEKTK